MYLQTFIQIMLIKKEHFFFYCSLFFSHDLLNCMSLIFEGAFIPSLLQHHLFYIWNLSGNWGVFCEMSANQNPGSHRDDKKSPVTLKWDVTVQIRVGMVTFAPVLGRSQLLLRTAIHQRSLSLVMRLQARGASRGAGVEDTELWLPPASG